MLHDHPKLFQRAILALDLLLIAGAIVASAWITGSFPWLGSAALEPETLLGLAWQSLVVGAAWILWSARIDFYRSRRTEKLGGEVVAIAEGLVVSFALGALLIFSITGNLLFQPFVAVGIALPLVACSRACIRLALHRIRSTGKNIRTILMVGRSQSAERIVNELARNPHFGLKVAGSFRFANEDRPPPPGIRDHGDVGRLQRVLEDQHVDSVLICPSSEVAFGATNEVFDLCDLAGIPCSYAPSFKPAANLRCQATHLGSVPAFRFTVAGGRRLEMATKRIVDVIGGLCGILITAPVMVASALIIKLYDGGPVLFRQQRIGSGGRPFNCYKFRSMAVDAEARKQTLEDQNESDGPVFKIRRDPRVTPFGRFLRRYSLDELPQLFNVLKGDMSLVGPRPPVPEEVKRYEWWQRRRISVRPGLTCIWQVWGRNRVSFRRWVEMDLYYIDNWSLWMDLKLMLHTVRCVVRGTGM